MVLTVDGVVRVGHVVVDDILDWHEGIGDFTTRCQSTWRLLPYEEEVWQSRMDLGTKCRITAMRRTPHSTTSLPRVAVTSSLDCLEGRPGRMSR